MTRWQHIVLGNAAALALFAVTELLPSGEFIFLILGSVSLLAAVIRGARLPLMWRVFITAYIIYWGYQMCLVGRTTQPRLTASTIREALAVFVIFGWGPALVLFRIWRTKLGSRLFCALLPICFAAAAIVAATEEHLFVRKYRDTGVGPTPRWTVSNHWLAYDKESQRLDGSD